MREATCTVAELLALPVHLMSYLLDNRMSTTHWDRTGSRRVLFRDALDHRDFADESPIDQHPDVPTQSPAKLLILHCTQCNDAALIDGNHRLARLALGIVGGAMSPVMLTRASGTDWTLDTPDMNRICRCLAP